MRVTVTITGEKAVIGSLGLLDVVGRKNLEKAVDRASAAILAGAQARVPVGNVSDGDSHPGALKKSLRRKIARSGMSAAVMAGYGEMAKGGAKGARSRGDKVKEGKGVYAPAIEFGSQGKPAEPFLFPALEAEKPGFVAACSAALKDGVREAERVT